MRNTTQDSNSITLANGLTIKATYAHSQGGLHVTLYVLNPAGHIFAYRHYGFAKYYGAPEEKMLPLLGTMKQLCVRSKLDSITQPRIQEAAAKALMFILTKGAVFKKAA